MPFISKDWRSPGEEWVKTEEGWEKKKILECGRQLLVSQTENTSSRPGKSRDVCSKETGKRTCQRAGNRHEGFSPSENINSNSDLLEIKKKIRLEKSKPFVFDMSSLSIRTAGNRVLEKKFHTSSLCQLLVLMLKKNALPFMTLMQTNHFGSDLMKKKILTDSVDPVGLLVDVIGVIIDNLIERSEPNFSRAKQIFAVRFDPTIWEKYDFLEGKLTLAVIYIRA
ncbi:hypothetical protein RUM43_001791 [Polyplax serrata]|uniref:Uncharacterized protein n=1 Tax=Polyplax serrata TaxID=468196 RepID=A0AAN8SG20_POLSC